MKSLNIYLASSFAYKSRCELLKNKLLKLKHKVPDIWWNLNSKQDNEIDYHWYNKPITKAISSRHFETIKKCDILILVCPEKVPGQFNGAAVEVGYALALGKPVYSFGFIPRSAMYSDIIKCYSLDELLNCINIESLSER